MNTFKKDMQKKIIWSIFHWNQYILKFSCLNLQLLGVFLVLFPVLLNLILIYLFKDKKLKFHAKNIYF